MLQLKKLEVRKPGLVDVTYNASHCTPGRSGTILELDVKLAMDTRTGKAVVSTELNTQLDTLDPNVALDKLAEWAERLAQTLRNRGPATPLAFVFEQPQ